jgi:transposase InsO family protein
MGGQKAALLVKRFADATPSEATIARIVRRAGLVRARRRRKPLSVIEQAPSGVADAPNDVWTMDFKGWWRTHDGSRCEPLTVRDAYSRYVLTIAVLAATTGAQVRAELLRLFKKARPAKGLSVRQRQPVHLHPSPWRLHRAERLAALARHPHRAQPAGMPAR